MMCLNVLLKFVRLSGAPFAHSALVIIDPQSNGGFGHTYILPSAKTTSNTVYDFRGTAVNLFATQSVGFSRECALNLGLQREDGTDLTT